MPIVTALVLALVISAVVFSLAARRGRSGDLADVRVDPDDPVDMLRHPWLKRLLLARVEPSTETGLLLTIAMAGVACAILAVGALLSMVRNGSGFAKWDDSAARFGARHATEDTTTFLKTVTDFGASRYIYAFIIVFGIAYFWRKHAFSATLFLATAVLSTMAVNNIVKVIVDRERPDIARLVGAHGSSFPSGHSAVAAATYASLALILGRGRGRRARIILAGAAAAITVAVASSRVLLGVHWLTDVIAGVCVGWSCFALCSMAFGGRILHFGQPVEAARDAAHLPSPASREVPADGARLVPTGQRERP